MLLVPLTAAATWRVLCAIDLPVVFPWFSVFTSSGVFFLFFFFNPFRTAVSFWGQLGTNYLEFECLVPQNGTGVLKGLTRSFRVSATSPAGEHDLFSFFSLSICLRLCFSLFFFRSSILENVYVVPVVFSMKICRGIVYCAYMATHCLCGVVFVAT